MFDVTLAAILNIGNTAYRAAYGQAKNSFQPSHFSAGMGELGIK